MITKNTMIGGSVASVCTLIGSIWLAAGFVNGKLNILEAVAADVAMNHIDLIEHKLEHTRTFRLELRAYLRSNPGDDDTAEDLDVVEDAIEDLQTELACLREGSVNC